MNCGGAGVAFIFLATLFFAGEVAARFFLLSPFYLTDGEGLALPGRPNLLPNFTLLLWQHPL